MSRFQVDPDISSARTLHTDFYTDPTLFEKSKELIFTRSWQFLAPAETLAAPDNALPINLLPDFLDEPLLITSDKEENFSCLSNVCTHRGNLLITEPCKVSNIRCRYHGRIFSINGKFVSMPEFREVRDFPSPADDLHSTPLTRWANMFFTSLAPSGAFSDFFGEMSERIGWMPLDKFSYRADLSRTYDVKAHWALYCENYLEGFHIPFVHAGLNSLIDYGDYQTELFRYSNLQLGIGKKGDHCFELPESSVDFGKNIAAYYFFVFPNMMFNFYPWGLSVNIVEPVSIDHTRVRFLSFLWQPQFYQQGAGGDLDKVEHEDEEVVENVQRGVRSRFYNHGRYSVTREQGTHHFHRIVSEFLVNEGR